MVSGLLMFVRALPKLWRIRNDKFLRVGIYDKEGGADGYYEYEVHLPNKPRAENIFWDAFRVR